MKIAVLHLTRMQRGFICVAGVDVAMGQHVRPVLPRGRLPDTMSARRGGPFDLATVVDLGATRAVGEPPEAEDYEFTRWHARATQAIEPDLYWEMLQYLARPTLRDLFGPDLRHAGRNAAIVEVGQGHASLGCFRPLPTPSLYVTVGRDGKPRPRIKVSDGTFDLDLSVTDLRLHDADHERLRMDQIDTALQRIEDGVPMVLSVGLTRPFASRSEDAPVHWLQVNNLHFEDDPTWRLSPDQPRPNALRTDEDSDLDDLPF